jgi:hypothetical protein
VNNIFSSADADQSEKLIIPTNIRTQPLRPPTPDRSTKKHISQSPQRYLQKHKISQFSNSLFSLEYFTNSYDMAWNKIYTDSTYKKGETVNKKFF